MINKSPFKIPVLLFIATACLVSGNTDAARKTRKEKAAENPFKVRNKDDRLEKLAQSGCKLNGQSKAPKNDLALWYRQPAAQWVEALPVGNGRLGAMVYGGINREILQLNEDTIWSGRPVERDQGNVPQAIEEARQLLFSGKYIEAQNIVNERVMGNRLEKGAHN